LHWYCCCRRARHFKLPGKFRPVAGRYWSTTLKRRYLPFREVVVTPTEGADPTSIRAEHADRLENSDGTISLRFDPERTSAAAVIAQATSVAEIADLHVNEPKLEDVVRLIYAEAER